MRVVDTNAHLGSNMGDDNADVVRRHNACMQLCAPIAQSVFGNSCFRVRDRDNMARTLCFSRLLFNAHVWSSLSPWAVRRLNEGFMRVLYKAGQWTGAKVRDCVNNRDLVLHFAEEFVLLGTAREKTSRHSARPSKRELPAPLGHPGQTGFCCSSGPTDTTCFSQLATRLKTRRPGQIASRGFLISGSDRCAAGFVLRQFWVKVRRKVEAKATPKTSMCSSL